MSNTSRFRPGDLIRVGESHQFRGAFVSTLYPGSSTGFRAKETLAFVIEVLERPHYLVMTFHEGVKFGWVLMGTECWTRVD